MMLKKCGTSIGCHSLGVSLPDLSELQSVHAGETVWVLGSGSSLGFVDSSFFFGKTVVSTNYSAHSIGLRPDYVFTHYHKLAYEFLEDSRLLTVVTLQKDTVTHNEWPHKEVSNLVMAPQDSYAAPGSSWDPFTRNPPRADSLAYGSSSLHGAMHLAAHLGAAHIILVGADCGTIDGQHRTEGYPAGHTPWALYNKHHKLMKDWLQVKYGVTVYSLNPFINFNLEGHRFDGL